MAAGPWSDVVRAPLLRLAVPFVLGMWLAGSTVPGLFGGWLAVGVSFILFLWMAHRKTVYGYRWMRGSALFLFAITIGGLLQHLASPLGRRNGLAIEEGEERPLIVKVVEVTGLSPSVVRCRSEALAWLHDDGTEPVEGGVLLMIRRDSLSSGMRAGDIIAIKAPVSVIDRVSDPGGFDRVRWAASQGIHHEAFVEPWNWSGIRHEPMFFSLFDQWRKNVSAWFDAMAIGPREKGLVKALILGVRNDIDVEQRDAFARSGTMHVLAVSGMHVGLIYWILTRMLGWLGRRTVVRWTRGAMVLAALWLFAGLAGGSPSIVRAALMFSVFTVADSWGRPSEPLNSISFASVALLVYDPSMLWHLGFQLSFMAVLGIILFHRSFVRLRSPRTVVGHYVWSAVCVTLAAQLMTTPLSLHAFGAFPTWFLPANLVVVLVSTLAIHVGIYTLLLRFVPLIGDLAQWMLGWLLTIMASSAQWFGSWPGAYPAVRIDNAQCALLYALVLLLPAAFTWRWRGGLWASLLAVVGLFTVWTVRLERRERVSSMVVHDFRDGVQCAFVEGTSMFVLQDSAASVSRYAERKLEQHARNWGIDHVQPVGADFSSSAQEWRLRGLTALVLPAGVQPVDTSDVDVLMLHGSGRLDLATTAARAHPEFVVLAPDMTMSARRHARTWCDDHGVQCHDIRRQGAFKLLR